MSSHNHHDDTLDLSLRHTLKNWTAREIPPSDTREELLAAALRQEAPTPRIKPARFNFGGWSFQFQNEFSEISVRVIYQYNLESVYALKPMAMS
ncbi:MAG TPA: hypothetical protein DEH25_00490 [Chloroflexi bacterium]|nr:hypothetical protein [Chloroflexota bacterium]HBY08684.1 hypothetical protein [Chloroflexota bacterium]